MAITDTDLRARNALIIAKCCYYRDVRAAGPGMPLFDDIHIETQCEYLELADYILAELDEYIG